MDLAPEFTRDVATSNAAASRRRIEATGESRTAIGNLYSNPYSPSGG
jgi:hypothetical protein